VYDEGERIFPPQDDFLPAGERMMKKTLLPVVLTVTMLTLVAGYAVVFGDAAPTAISEKEKPVKRSGKPTDITYDDLNTEMPADTKWDPKYLTDRIKELDRKTVRVAGFMLADFRTKGITEFVMLKNTECKFGPEGPAHHVIMVHLGSGEETRYTTRALNLEGVLLVKPWEGPDGNTWALYELQDAVVK
jgi:hypothetical protein